MKLKKKCFLCFRNTGAKDYTEGGSYNVFTDELHNERRATFRRKQVTRLEPNKQDVSDVENEPHVTETFNIEKEQAIHITTEQSRSMELQTKDETTFKDLETSKLVAHEDLENCEEFVLAHSDSLMEATAEQSTNMELQTNDETTYKELETSKLVAHEDLQNSEEVVLAQSDSLMEAVAISDSPLNMLSVRSMTNGVTPSPPPTALITTTVNSDKSIKTNTVSSVAKYSAKRSTYYVRKITTTWRTAHKLRTEQKAHT
jgi:hypothetical protein